MVRGMKKFAVPRRASSAPYSSLAALASPFCTAISANPLVAFMAMTGATRGTETTSSAAASAASNLSSVFAMRPISGITSARKTVPNAARSRPPLNRTQGKVC